MQEERLPATSETVSDSMSLESAQALARAALDALLSVRETLRRPFLVPPRGLLIGAITNVGDRPASGVALTVSGAQVASIYRVGQADTVLVVSGPIELGSIRSGEAVTIRVWLNRPYDASRLDRQVSLVHDDGVGAVSMAIPVRGPGLLLTRYWSLIRIVGIGLGAYVVVLGTFVLYNLLRGKHVVAEQTSDASPPAEASSPPQAP
jgi:hypothetical protein